MSDDGVLTNPVWTRFFGVSRLVTTGMMTTSPAVGLVQLALQASAKLDQFPGQLNCGNGSRALVLRVVAPMSSRRPACR